MPSHHGSISLLSLVFIRPHSHTTLALLIQGKERLVLSAWTGHHKLFFLKRRKKHLLLTVTSSPPSSLPLSHDPMGCVTQKGTKGHFRAVSWGHRGTQGCTRLLCTNTTLQEAEELSVIKEMRAVTTTRAAEIRRITCSFILHIHHQLRKTRE